MSIKQIKSLVQFSRGGSIVWNSLTTPLPDGVVAFAIDDRTFKLGDGVTLYQALPTLFTFNDLVEAQGGISGLFAVPTAGNQGAIVTVSIGTSGSLEYRPSNVTLTALLGRLDALEAGNVAQDTAIGLVIAAALDINVNINTAPDDNVVVITNGLYADSGVSMTQLTADIQSQVTYSPGAHLQDPVWYTSADMDIEVAGTELTSNVKDYYVKIAGYSSRANVAIEMSLTCATPGVVISKLSTEIFKVNFSGITFVDDKVPVVFIAGIDDGDGGVASKAVATLIRKSGIMVAIYGGTLDDVFNSVAVDSNDNIICAGYTGSEGVGSPTYENALVVKFDTNLNILARKIYGGAHQDRFFSVSVDSANNIICVGQTLSEGSNIPTYNNALVVKFDSNLNILARKVYDGPIGHDMFYGVVIDSKDNVICVGRISEGTYTPNAVVIKFDSSLNILARKVYGGTGTGTDTFNAVAVDSANNIICVGVTDSEGVGSPTYYNALVVKFDTNLNILARKIYGGTNHDSFSTVAVDSNGNIFCLGWTGSEGPGAPTYYDMLILKFDTNLTILAKKLYSRTYSDVGHSIAVDSNNNIICVGYSNSGGVTSSDGVILKLDNSLNVISSKLYNAYGNDIPYAAAVDSFDNVVVVGYTSSEGSGLTDGFVIKLPSSIPSGTFADTTLQGIKLSDLTIALVDSNLTLANSTLTLTNSALTLADSALTLSDSNLAYTVAEIRP